MMRRARQAVQKGAFMEACAYAFNRDVTGRVRAESRREWEPVELPKTIIGHSLTMARRFQDIACPMPSERRCQNVPASAIEWHPSPATLLLFTALPDAVY
jgi:hypothetical protein